MPIPTPKPLLVPLLHTISNLAKQNGTAEVHITETYDPLAVIFKVTPEERKIKRKYKGDDNRTKFEHTIAMAATWLGPSRLKCLECSNGYYTLTAKGKDVVERTKPDCGNIHSVLPRA